MSRDLVDLPTLASRLSVTEAEAQEWSNDGVIPPPKMWRGKFLWNWTAVDQAMSGESHWRIYFVEAHGYIKIGFTRDLDRRVSVLDQVFPEPIILLHHIPGTTRTEMELHRKFAHLRVRGEWFRKAPDLMDYIEQIKSKKTVCPARNG